MLDFCAGILMWYPCFRLLVTYVTLQRNLENRRQISLTCNRTVASDCDRLCHQRLTTASFNWVMFCFLLNKKSDCTPVHAWGLSRGTVIVTDYAALFSFFVSFIWFVFPFFVRLCCILYLLSHVHKN